MTGQLTVDKRIRIAVAMLQLEPELTVSRAAFRVGVPARQVGAHWRQIHGRSRRRFSQAAIEAQIEPFASLCDEVADVLTERPQSASVIFARFPAVHERRLWRVLDRLISSKRAIRNGMRYAGSTYTRAP